MSPATPVLNFYTTTESTEFTEVWAWIHERVFEKKLVDMQPYNPYLPWL